MFTIDVSKNTTISVIDEIIKEEMKQDNVYNLVIYFVKKNDTLWQIAKKFKSTVEDIIKVNAIENPTKIFEGQQLYIPRFTNTKQISA